MGLFSSRLLASPSNPSRLIFGAHKPPVNQAEQNQKPHGHRHEGTQSSAPGDGGVESVEEREHRPKRHSLTYDRQAAQPQDAARQKRDRYPEDDERHHLVVDGYLLLEGLLLLRLLGELLLLLTLCWIPCWILFEGRKIRGGYVGWYRRRDRCDAKDHEGKDQQGDGEGV
jgi:hypothetical protein